MGHNQITADGLLGAQSCACIVPLLHTITQSLWCDTLCRKQRYSSMLWAKNNSISWNQERIIYFCKLNEKTPLKRDCVSCSEVVGCLWMMGIRNWIAYPLVANTVRKWAANLRKDQACNWVHYLWTCSIFTLCTRPEVSATDNLVFASLLSAQLSDSYWWVCQANVWYPLSSERDGKCCC